MNTTKETDIRTLRGMRDVLPPESRRWLALEATLRQVFNAYGFQEIRTPLVEAVGLFQHSLGTETDIVQKQMYVFQDRKERWLALRPESTASIVRAYLEHGLASQNSLVKWYYLGPMFRAERPQAGRQRQFHQAGIEALGSLDPLLDVEIMALCMNVLTSLEITDATLFINNLGCREDQAQMREGLRAALTERQAELCDTCQSRLAVNVLRVLDCKRPECRHIIESLPKIDTWVCEACRTHGSVVEDGLREVGVEYVHHPWLVRGLDYYTRTVFEVVHERLGAQDAVGGGGRYDDLVERFGGSATGAIGFAMGIERLLLTVGDTEPSAAREGVYVAVLEDGARASALAMAQRLRGAGYVVELDYEGRSVKAQMRQADRLSYAATVFVGGDEWNAGELACKHLGTGEQVTIPRDQVEDQLHHWINGQITS